MAKLKNVSWSASKSLTDRTVLAQNVDPFNLAAPFSGDTHVGDVKNHIWVSIAVKVYQRAVLRGDYILLSNGVKGPTVFDHLFDMEGSNAPIKTVLSKSIQSWCWEGEFFWYYPSGFKVPEEIIVLDPRRVYHTSDSPGTCRYFYNTHDGRVIGLTEENSLHVMEVNRYSEVRGVFPLFTVGNTLLKQDALINAGNLDALDGGAVPDVVLKAKLRLSPKQADEAISYWNKAYNRPHGGSRVAAIGNNMDVMQLDKDLIKYIDLLDWNRTGILAFYGIPLKVANAETGKTALSGKDSNEQYRALFSQTIIPLLEYISGEINRGFFSKQGHPEIHGIFSFDKVAELQEDENKLSQRENEDIKTGKVTINEIRAKHGLGDVEWGDVPPPIFFKGATDGISKTTGPQPE